MSKSLDIKLKTIKNGAYTPKDFIIADAKDGDMAMGMVAPGPDPANPGHYKSKLQYLDDIRKMTEASLVDIMLLSASSADVLVNEGLFAASPVTAAVRLNDTTDIWALRGNRYQEKPSRPFATINMTKARSLTDLGLFSVTFSNDLDHDYATTEAYKLFREEASEIGFKHFLEIFNPAPSIETGLSPQDLPFFVNDAIARILGGVMSDEQPLFLKMQYNGPKALEELVAYDPTNLIVGILGGSAGTTRDTFELVYQAEKYGARVALFGRKINLADDPIALVTMMRKVVQRELKPAEAVRLYHDKLVKSDIIATRPLAEDSEITEPILKG